MKSVVLRSLTCWGLFESSAQAAGLNIYASLSESFCGTQMYAPIFGALWGLLLLLVVGLLYRSAVDKSITVEQFDPSGRVSLAEGVDLTMDFLYQLTKDNCGKNFIQFLPFISGLFLFILMCNLSGLVPGFVPATENFSINLAMGCLAFVVYNFAGIREHGVKYIQQFSGPMLVLAPLFLCIETISHSVRPLSLAFRLLANIFCDHLIVGVFSSIVPLVVPAVFLFFGLLVAVVQSFVFALLTAIYISMAISHDH
ncbi:MAG: F0F1 ATP synthase subunit A [Zetaproteobacteria bacterium]|nr:F0F1 ATP synthase subunit A [Zetaproteobacteria bacterium]